MKALSPFRAWLLVFAFCVAAIFLSIAYLDRPVVDYVHSHLRDTVVVQWASRGLGLLRVIPVLALALLVASGIWLMAGSSLGSWTYTPLICSWSVALALSTTMVLKHIFGRILPDPYYVVDHIYEFHPLQGDLAHLAFPSGTMAISGAIMSVLWLRHPRLRATAMLILAVLAIALVITNSHWLADLIAGLFLGAFIGRVTILLLEPRDATSAGGRIADDASAPKEAANLNNLDDGDKSHQQMLKQ